MCSLHFIDDSQLLLKKKFTSQWTNYKYKFWRIFDRFAWDLKFLLKWRSVGSWSRLRHFKFLCLIFLWEHLMRKINFLWYNFLPLTNKHINSFQIFLLLTYFQTIRSLFLFKKFPFQPQFYLYFHWPHKAHKNILFNFSTFTFCDECASLWFAYKTQIFKNDF